MNHKVKINLNSTQINDEINLKMHEIKLQIKAYQKSPQPSFLLVPKQDNHTLNPMSILYVSQNTLP